MAPTDHDPIAGPDDYPEAPRDPSIDGSMSERDDIFEPDGPGCSWADMMECHRTGLTLDALRKQRERQAEQNYADWMRELDCPGSGPAWLRPWKPGKDEE
jgi:hypothetical protein